MKKPEALKALQKLCNETEDWELRSLMRDILDVYQEAGELPEDEDD